MAVLVNERKEGKLLFLINAENLQVMTEQILMNDKYVPKKYRFCWVQNLLQMSIDVYSDVRRANIIYPKTASQLKKRISYLERAEQNAAALLGQIHIARRTQPKINSHVMQEWEILCANTRKHISLRIKGDLEIFKNLL